MTKVETWAWKSKSVALSRQIRMMSSMQPTLIDTWHLALSHLALHINIIHWKIFILYFILNMDTLRFLLDSKFESWSQVIIYLPLFSKYFAYHPDKKAISIVYTGEYMLKCVLFTNSQFRAWPEHWLPIPISFHINL